MSIGTCIRVAASMGATIALLLTTSVLATTPAPLTQCTTSNFVVTAAVQTSNGSTTYTYTMVNAPGKSKNLNKFFIYTERGLTITGEVNGSLVMPPPVIPGGRSIANGSFAFQLPPSSAWKWNKHNDGFLFTGIAKTDVLKLNVPERFDPAGGRSTIIIKKSSTSYYHDDDDDDLEVCGPILGPTAPAAPELAGIPVMQDQTDVTMGNGCVYRLTFNSFSNYLSGLSKAPQSPLAGTDSLTCEVTPGLSILTELELQFAPPTKKGDPPIQKTLGGTCYYTFPDGSVAKFPC